MRVRYATQPSSGRQVNEDHVFHTGDLVGVLDGVSVPPGVDTGCVHGPAWYTRRLADHLARTTASPAVPLADALAEAISAVRDEHAHTCDLDNPQTPASTVCLVRDGGDHVDYLLLCDSHLILDHQGDRELQVLTDTRFAACVADIRRIVLTGASPFGTSDHEERVRQAAQLRQQYTNQPGGYWIAAALPQAAYESLTGTLPLSGPSRLRRAALLTDGASAAVDQFALVDWRGLLDLLSTHGPEELIRRVRQAENADPTGARRPRYKRHDDATVALCEFDTRSQ